MLLTPKVSAIADLAVTFAPPDWQVSLDMPDEVTVLDPIATTMAVTPSIASQYTADLINADTGSYANMSCGTGAGPCSKNINTGWMTGLPVTRHYQAQMTLGTTTFSSPIRTVVIFCDSLLFFPGTHVQNTSTSDQENACVLASQASGATVEDVIRAALAAMAAAGIAVNSQSLLAWLQHYIWEHGGTTVPPGPPPPPGHPTNPPSPTPVPVASAVDALAASLTARNAAIAALGAAAATEIARRCLNLTGDEGISGDPCKTRPIFLPGSDFPTATNHRIAAIASWPAWVRLHRRFGERTNWYKSQPECQNIPAGNECDEFPENRTYEGGNPGATKHRPSLSRTVSDTDNGGLGRKFGVFLGRQTPAPTGCKIPDGGEFLVIPLPPALGIPTQTSVCNFPLL
jgi:hypothetical protein